MSSLKTLILLTSVTTLCAQGATLYSEVTSGDLANSLSSPTYVGSLAAGVNDVIGTINASGTSEHDFFTFTVPTGYLFTSLSYTFSTTLDKHFLAMTNATPPLNPYSEEFLFMELMDGAQNGVNILPLLTDGGNVAGDSGELDPMGYTLPLTAGDYTIWFQETSNNPVSYTFSMTAQQIPEPSTALLSGIAVAALGLRRSRAGKD